MPAPTEAPQNVGGELPEEDIARAECYALVSRLFYGPPDDDLLKQLSRSNAVDADSENTYVRSFEALRHACRQADAWQIRQQYDDLFVGAGKALVSPYTSAYAAPQGPDRHLVALRERLAAWGLARRDSAFEFEDHVSAVCDVMRWLIVRGRSLEHQLAFFDTFAYPGLIPFCNAIDARSTSEFYRAVAGVARAVAAIEKEAFEMREPE